jgi:hypothetical protein
MRKVLEDLIFLGAVEEEVKAFGKSWKMRTLSSKDHLDATKETGNFDTLTRIYALKMENLGRALQSVDGVTFVDKNESLELVKQMQPIIVNKLYEEYETLQKKQNTSLENLEELKN